jgi:hypothetical protein
MDYGVFTPLWEPFPYYQLFFSLVENFSSNTLKTGLFKLRSVITDNSLSDIKEGIDIVLSNPNWRMHIIGIFTAFAIKNQVDDEILESLWNCLRHGSWVSPQVCVILQYIDSNFDTKALNLIDEEKKILYTGDLTPAQSHTMRGPAGLQSEETKLTLALQYLLDGTIQSGYMGDNGGEIVKGWKQKFDSSVFDFPFFLVS